MDIVNKGAMTPLYLETGRRRLFSIYHAPQNGYQKHDSFIYVPPFAEEMNLARRMAALQARALAGAGAGVLLLDLFGTGDSDGDFCDARWELWMEDILAAADWLEAQGHARIGLWGLRMGGLLAAVAAAGRPDRFKRLLLWQPITDGRTMLTQFLRFRVAASMRNAGRETTDGLRAELAEKRSIEVAGYTLSVELAQALDTVRLDALDLQQGMRVDWFQVLRGTDDRFGSAAQRVVDAWRDKGLDVSTLSVAGEMFWAVPETATATELISATTRSVEVCPVH